MTTFISTTYSYPGSSTLIGDAEFQDYCQHTVAMLTAVGLVQTADTGQMDETTVTEPAANDWSRYQIWRFNDSRQGVDPVFLRIEFGKYAGQDNYVFWRVSIGQGTDGAGTLTGQTWGPYQCGYVDGNGTVSSTVQDYACAIEGYLFLAQAVGWIYGRGDKNSLISIARTKDLSGNFDGKGLQIVRQYGGANAILYAHSIRWDGAGFNGDRGNNEFFCIVPGTPADTTVNGDKRLFPHFHNMPNIVQAWATFTIRNNEISGSPITFNATPFPNGGQHAYLHLGDTAPCSGEYRNLTDWRTVFLFE